MSPETSLRGTKVATRMTFERVVQDAEEFGSTETRVVSRVFFELETGGETYREMFVDLTEPVGGDHAEDTLAVGTPQHVGTGQAFNPGVLDQQAFERAVRTYYRSLVNSAGFGKHLAKDKGFRTHGDILGLMQTVEL